MNYKFIYLFVYCFSYNKDFENIKENIKVQIKTEVDVFDDTKHESFFMRDNNFVSSFSSTTHYSINSYIENKPTNFNLNIESSTATYIPTKHNVITSEKSTQIKTEVDIIDDAIFESHIIQDNKYMPSVEPTTYGIKSNVEINPRNFNLNIKTSTKTLTPTKHNVITSEKNTQIKTEIDIIEDTMYESFFMHEKNYVSTVESPTYYDINSPIKNSHKNAYLNIKAPIITSNPTKKNLRTSKENSKKTHKCYICNKYFSWKGSMKTHMRLHLGKKPYQCLICNKSFSQVSTLYQHKIIHESHKPFNCAICKKSFAQKVNMKIHINKHMKLL